MLRLRKIHESSDDGWQAAGADPGFHLGAG